MSACQTNGAGGLEQLGCVCRGAAQYVALEGAIPSDLIVPIIPGTTRSIRGNFRGGEVHTMSGYRECFSVAVRTVPPRAT